MLSIKMRYSIEPKDRIYVKGHGFLSFAKKMGIHLSNKYSKKLLDIAKKSTTDAIKTASKGAIQKTAEATSDLIGNKIAYKITSHSKKSSKTEADVERVKKILGSGKHKQNNNDNTKTIIISNDKMKDIIEIVKSLEDSGLLFEGATETVQNEVKEQKGGFLSMLLGTLGATLLGNILSGGGINRAGEGIVRAGYGNKNHKMDF